MVREHPTPGWPGGDVRYWAAYDYPNERIAKRAWEDAERNLKEVSVWRLHAPREPPYRHFYVVVLGEQRHRVTAAERRLRRFTGATEFTPDESLLTALCNRRLGQATEAVLSGDVGRKRMMRTPGGSILNPDGTLSPYKRPQG